MEMVRHKMFGMGEVIGKDVISGYTCLKVRFASGTEKTFVIPQSFETGVVEALGSLKDEVDRAIAEKRESLSAPAPAKTPAVPSGKRSVKYIPSDPVADAFEKYLIAAGYRIETASGNPSTVYSYINAVESVLTEEGISWDTLKTDIDSIVNKYDEGGPMSWFGAKSNRTVISALKQFAGFVGKP